MFKFDLFLSRTQAVIAKINIEYWNFPIDNNIVTIETASTSFKNVFFLALRNKPLSILQRRIS